MTAGIGASMKGRDRLDKILFDRGLVRSRERAKALIMAGKVTVNGSRVLKAGTLVDAVSDIAVRISRSFAVFSSS